MGWLSFHSRSVMGASAPRIHFDNRVGRLTKALRDKPERQKQLTDAQRREHRKNNTGPEQWHSHRDELQQYCRQTKRGECTRNQREPVQDYVEHEDGAAAKDAFDVMRPVSCRSHNDAEQLKVLSFSGT